MAKSDNIQEVDRQSGDVKKARRFDDRDWKWICEYVIEEYNRRKQARSDRERAWKEIDRQIAMEPEVDFKRLPNGQIDDKKKWMAETELPLQAQALEVLTADARRMMFSDAGNWFKAHAETSDEFFEKASHIKIPGLEMDMQHHINQDNADKLVEGFLLNSFRQYDHTSRFDIINAESFKYGMGVGRARVERKNIYIFEARGVRSEKQKIPVIVPCSIKNLYLEEPKPNLHSSTVLGPAHIAHEQIRYENLALAANKGSTDPDDFDGGWMPRNLSKVLPGKGGYVEVLEMEGDIVVPRRTVKSVVIPGAIITVALGGADSGGGSTRAVIRFRFRKYPFSSYLLFPYMHESADDAYPTGPLMKGRTVQQTATDAVNRFLDSAMLKCLPPVGYDRNDPTFAQSGGPEIYPTAQWESTDPITVYDKIGGDPSALANAALQFINLYAQLTGVLPARVGAQTVSHTTAYAKDAELQRGAVRTTDYVNQIGHGPLTAWLGMAYRLGLDALGPRETISFYIEAYGGYVELDKSMLPEAAHFEWFGSGGPQEKQQKAQAKLQGLEVALKMDQLAMQMGNPPSIDVPGAIREILREAGWTDLEKVMHAPHEPRPGGPAGPPAPTPGVPGPPNGSGGPAVAALQNLSSPRPA
jgi:hypothetical protein